MPDRTVRVSLVIDEHGAVKAIKGVGDEGSRTEKKLGTLDRGIKGLGSSFKNLLIGAGGIAAVGYGLEKIYSKTSEVATETEKFASLSGFGATQSLRYSVALKARNIDTEKAAKIFGLLGKNMQSAEQQESKFARATLKSKTTTELGKQAKAFQELLGPGGVGSLGKLSDEGKFKAITEAFEKMPDGIKKSRIEMQLFGRGGNVLSTVLDKNNLSLNHQIKLVEKFYPTLKGGAAGLKELIERQAESKLAWEGMEFTIGTKLMPVFNQLLAIFTKAVGWLRELGISGHTATAGLAALAGVMVVSKIAGFAAGLKGLAAILPTIAFSPEFIAGLGAVIAAAAIVKHFLPKPHPAAEHAALRQRSKQGALGPSGVVGYHWAHGAVAAGMPGIGGLSGHLGGEHVVRGGVEAGMLNALDKANAVHRVGSRGEVHVYIDGKQVSDAIVQNTYGIRRISEGVAHYGLKRTARE